MLYIWWEKRNLKATLGEESGGGFEGCGRSSAWNGDKSLRLLTSSSLIVLLLLVGCDYELPPNPLRPAEFTEAFIGRLRTMDSTLKIARPDPLTVVVNDCVTCRLDSAYSLYLQAPEDMNELIVQRASLVLDMLDESEEDAVDLQRVLPVVRSAEFADALRKEAQSPEERLSVYTEALNQDLVVMYVLDSETSYRFLGLHDVTELGLQPGELRKKAVQNLVEAILPADKDDHGKFFALIAGGNFETGLLLVDGLWDELAGEVDGDVVVAIPNRDDLLVTGREDEAGVDALRQHAQELYRDGSYPVSEKLFLRMGDKWVRYR